MSFLRPSRQTIRDWILCFSLANLFFAKAWDEVQRGFAFSGYYKKAPNLASASILIDVVLLAIVLWLVGQLIRRRPTPWLTTTARCMFLLLLLVPLNFVRQKLNWNPLAVTQMAKNPLAWLLVAGGICAAVRWSQRTIRGATALVMMLSPLVLITWGQALAHWDWGSERRSLSAGPTKGIAAKLPSRQTRLVWLLFDEMDQRLAFAERPASVHLPELDRLRRECVYFENANPPGNETLRSIPALLTGRLVIDAQPTGRGRLLLTLGDNSKVVDWQTLPNVFSLAGEIGFETAAVGFFHPYPRVLRGSVTKSAWESFPLYDPTGEASLSESLGRNLYTIIEQAVRKKMGDHERYRTMHEGVLRTARTYVTDAQSDLVYCHILVPHLPGMAKEFEGRLPERPQECAEQYLSNLMQADRVFGELRQLMESGGLWDRTTLIITSDHWLRDPKGFESKIDHRVPLLIKMAGHSEPQSYARPMNTLLLSRFCLATLRGEVKTADEVARWMDANRDSVPVEAWRFCKKVEPGKR